MTQDVNSFPVPALLTEGVGNCVLLAPLTSSGALGGAGAGGAAAQAHFVSANPAIGSFNFDATLGITQGTSGAGAGQALQYSMSNGGLQSSFVTYTASFTIDKTVYTSTTDHYLFSTAGGSGALYYGLIGASGKHVYTENGVDSAPNIITYPENKPAQVQHVLRGTSTRYDVYIDGLKIISGPRSFASAAWGSFYVASLTVLVNGITTNHMRDFALQNRTIQLPPGKIKRTAHLGHSFFALSSVPVELFTATHFIDWLPCGKSKGKGYAIGDVLTPVGTAVPSGTGGTITVDTVDAEGGVLTSHCSGGATYIAGSIVTGVTGGTGKDARFVIVTVSSGAMATTAPLNPFGYQGGASALLTTGGYNMLVSDVTALATYSRGDTSAICQTMRQLYKAGHYPTENAHRSEAGCTVAQLIGTTAATSRAFLCGFEAMKTADNVHPDIIFCHIGENEVAEGTSGGANFTIYDAQCKILLSNAAADGCQLFVFDEVLCLANNPTYSAQAYTDRSKALNTIINALPAWAISQGMRMKVAVNPLYAQFGGDTPNSALFRPNDIHPNAFGSSLMGYSAGQVAVRALSGSVQPGTLVLSPLGEIGITL